MRRLERQRSNRLVKKIRNFERLESRVLLSVNPSFMGRGEPQWLDPDRPIATAGKITDMEAYNRELDGFFAKNPEISDFRRIGPQTLNANAANVTNANALWPRGTEGLSLSGDAVTVGIWDSGAVQNHVEFAGRLTVVDPVALSDHATHVAGTIGATGLDQNARGMANSVTIRSRDFNNDLVELVADADAIDLSNHSYGRPRGWQFDLNAGLVPACGPGDYWLANRTFFTEDPLFGEFDEIENLAITIDDTIHDTPLLTSVWAAGNDRDDVFLDVDQDGAYFTFFQLDPNNPAMQFCGAPQAGWQGQGWYSVPAAGPASPFPHCVRATTWWRPPAEKPPVRFLS